ERGDAPGGQGLEAGVRRDRIEETDEHVPRVHALDPASAAREGPHLEKDARRVQDFRSAPPEARALVLDHAVRKARGHAGAGLEHHLDPRLGEQGKSRGHDGHAPLARARLLEHACDHRVPKLPFLPYDPPPWPPQPGRPPRAIAGPPPATSTPSSA